VGLADGVLVEEDWVFALGDLVTTLALTTLLLRFFSAALFVEDDFIFEIDVEHNQLLVLLHDVRVDITTFEDAEGIFEVIFEWIAVVSETSVGTRVGVAKLHLGHTFIRLLTVAILNEKSIDIQLVVEEGHHFLANLLLDALFEELGGGLLIGSQSLPLFIQLLE
jgi:hypothetical protein